MDHRVPAPPRAVRGPARLLRGWAGAVAMTLLAAVFHAAAAADGSAAPSPAVLLLAAVLAAPLCTLLAGRALSLWRTVAAVAGAQGIFHVLYSLSSAGAAVTAAPGADAGHLAHGHPAALQAGPLLTAAADAAPHAAGHGAGMLLAHVIAGVVTVAVLRQGERLVVAAAERALEATPVLALLTLLLVGPLVLTRPVRVPAAPVVRVRPSVLVLGTPGRRGPPALVLAA